MVNMTDYRETIEKELPFTEEEMEQLDKAKNMPITFDEDCPETTPERALKFRRVNPPRKTSAPA
ncbi:MAG: hypothetical protein IK133_04255 [Clostridia bacterium]|nr:hypothetical protein [Clostridia bacterium]